MQVQSALLKLRFQCLTNQVIVNNKSGMRQYSETLVVTKAWL